MARLMRRAGGVTNSKGPTNASSILTNGSICAASGLMRNGQLVINTLFLLLSWFCRCQTFARLSNSFLFSFYGLVKDDDRSFIVKEIRIIAFFFLYSPTYCCWSIYQGCFDFTVLVVLFLWASHSIFLLHLHGSYANNSTTLLHCIYNSL